ncbi:uncharacterized protein LOC107422424 [Ziziphus jujuba]|nr:uncharacterized protein LOC107422424 [Ziziphus jujuba]
MELPIPNKLRKLWDIWDLRVCIQISLFLQVFLLLFAPFRQTSRRTFVITSIWSAYLMADWVAAVAIGLITKSQTDHSVDPHSENQDIFAFWASFLLIHLGGPDSITSFSIEDNELWLRHLFSLILQVLAVAYSFFLTLPENKLQLPTALVFFLGIIKFSERTAALFFASLDRFGWTVLPEPNPGPDYRDAVATYASMGLMDQVAAVEPMAAKFGNTVVKSKFLIDDEKVFSDTCDEIKFLQVAYSFFETFKGLIVGFLLSSKDRESSRNTFLNLKPAQAFKLVEYELNFMYELLHTKVVMMHCKLGCVLKITSFCVLIGALTSFSFCLLNDPEFSNINIYFTYSLLVVAIFLDIVSSYNLIFSKWTLIFLKDGWIDHIPKRILKYLSKERWSWSISQYNIVRYCLDERPKWLYKAFRYLHLKGVLETMKILRYSSSETVTKDFETFIYDELKIKSKTASSLSDAIEVCSQRGEWALLRSSSSYVKLKWSIGEFQYAESLLLWHLATELCYSTIKEGDRNERQVCKLLSDYMFYLLVAKPAMLAPVLGNWQVVFQDTCAEAMRFFNEFSISDQSQACQVLISVETKFRATTVKGNRSKSVLFDACVLAHQLQNLKEERWNVMKLVWAELFCYAAINCRPIVHAQQPSRGGEFLTFTWLLMNHFGLGTQFYEQEQQAGKKSMLFM